METERYHHEHQEGQLGTTWRPRENEPRMIAPHTCTVGELISDSHYDVFAKYGFAKTIAQGSLDKEYRFWTHFYDKMQTTRAGFSDSEAFIKMVHEFAEFGFKSEHPIPVDENYNLLDGSHRVACAALFNANPKVEVYRAGAHHYDRDWFQANGFTEEELKIVDEIRKNLLDKFHGVKSDEQIAIVWASALENWEQIIDTIDNDELRRAFIKDLQGDIKKFIIDSYEMDGMANERIQAKAGALASIDSKVGILVINTPHSSANTLKTNIRQAVSPKMKDYVFDNIVHLIDNKDIGKQLLEKYQLGFKQ